MPEFWTSRAWTDSHSDYFTRNILTIGDLGGWDSAEAATYAEWAPNNARPTWPTLDELMRWVESINNYPGLAPVTTVPVEVHQLCLDAAIERMAGRTHLQVRPVDSAGAVDPDGDPVEIPAAVKLATVMQAARWARRPMTPDGLANAGDIIIGTTGLDQDVERLIAPWLALGLY